MRSLRDLRALATRPVLHYENGDAMNDTTQPREEYTPPAIEVKGSLNELTQAGQLSGGLDSMYPVGDPSRNDLFS
jgi:hypothetical protein